MALMTGALMHSTLLALVGIEQSVIPPTHQLVYSDTIHTVTTQLSSDTAIDVQHSENLVLSQIAQSAISIATNVQHSDSLLLNRISESALIASIYTIKNNATAITTMSNGSVFCITSVSDLALTSTEQLVEALLVTSVDIQSTTNLPSDPLSSNLSLTGLESVIQHSLYSPPLAGVTYIVTIETQEEAGHPQTQTTDSAASLSTEVTYSGGLPGMFDSAMVGEMVAAIDITSVSVRPMSQQSSGSQSLSMDLIASQLINLQTEAYVMASINAESTLNAQVNCTLVSGSMVVAASNLVESFELTTGLVANATVIAPTAVCDSLDAKAIITSNAVRLAGLELLVDTDFIIVLLIMSTYRPRLQLIGNGTIQLWEF